MEKKSPFQQIDEALFRLVDQFKAQPVYLKFQELTAKLGEQEQKILNLSLSYFVLVLPLLILFVIMFMNNSLRSDIEDKQAILEEINYYNQTKAKTDGEGQQIIVQTPMSAQSELQAKISQLLSRTRIPTTSVSVRSFNEGTSAGSLKEFNAEIVFDKLSTAQFTDLVKQLEQRERLRVSGLLIENRVDQSILKGKLNISFLTQNLQ